MSKKFIYAEDSEEAFWSSKDCCNADMKPLLSFLILICCPYFHVLGYGEGSKKRG